MTWGHPDTVRVGDAGIPAMLGSVLARESTADDARMRELLEPFRPHRHRNIQLAFVARQRPPRTHHRTRSPDIRRL